MNTATRNRKRQAEDPTAWLWEDLPDPFASFEERHDPTKNATGVDFEYNKLQELKHFTGQVTRIDLVELPNGAQVKRTWLAGWTPGDKAHEAKALDADWTIESAAALLEAQGWKVRRWRNEQGKLEARAFRCGLRCVRTAGYRQRWNERNSGQRIERGIRDSRFDG